MKFSSPIRSIKWKNPIWVFCLTTITFRSQFSSFRSTDKKMLFQGSQIFMLYLFESHYNRKFEIHGKHVMDIWQRYSKLVSSVNAFWWGAGLRLWCHCRSLPVTWLPVTRFLVTSLPERRGHRKSRNWKLSNRKSRYRILRDRKWRHVTAS